MNILSSADVRIEEPRYLRLFDACIRRIGAGESVVSGVTVRLRTRGRMPGLAGLATFEVSGFRAPGSAMPSRKHTITFYTGLMDRLSDRAVTGVMAHEIAHVWLNEFVGPEASGRREKDADVLAEMWGFGAELKALSEETEPFE